MKGLDELKVVPYSGRHVANAYPEGDLPWQVYHQVRNALVQTCRRFGPTGPMGVVQIVADVEDPYLMVARDRNFWERGDADPVYFIIDDQHNHERYCYAELLGDDPLSAGWLLSVVETLRSFPDWGLGINNIPDSYLLIWGDRLLVNGHLAHCKTAMEVVETARQLLKRGAKKWWQFWK